MATPIEELAKRPKRRGARGGARGGTHPNARNAMRHGLRGSNLPAGCSYIRQTCNLFRRALEDAVMEARGAVTLADACLIQTAERWERHAQLCQRWLVVTEELSPADKTKFSGDVARASTERDKCLKALGIEPRALDEVQRFDRRAALDAIPQAQDGGEGEPSIDHAGATPRQNAADATHGDSSAAGWHHTIEPADAENGESRVPGEGENGNGESNTTTTIEDERE